MLIILVLIVSELSQFFGVSGAELMMHIYDFAFSLYRQVITNYRIIKDGDCWIPMKIATL